MFDELTPENFVLFAAKHYWSIHYSMAEFESDLQRIVYIKRLLKKYKKTGKVSERLILNHLILLYNVFEPTVAVNRMLFFKIDSDCYSSLKTFLVYLNRIPETIIINNNIVVSSDIQVDMNVANLLRVL